MGQKIEKWSEFYREANHKMLIEKLNELGYEKTTCKIAPTCYYDLGKIDTEELELNNVIDLEIYKKVRARFEKFSLTKHLDNISFLLRKGYINKAFLFLNREHYVDDIQNIFSKIDAQHTEVVFKGQRRDVQFTLRDKAFLLFIKKAIVNELLSSIEVQFDLANIFNGTYNDELKENEAYFVVMHQIATYLKNVNTQLSENTVFELTYKILYDAKLLPKKQLDNFADIDDTDYARYVRVSINNLYSQRPFLNPKALPKEIEGWKKEMNNKFDDSFVNTLIQIATEVGRMK